MPTLLLRFPAGRYHATPPGHHVNEGQIEWPPSPWRLVRALLACGYTHLGWTTVPPEGRRLLEALAGTLPRYRLPPATAAHSRHYMPICQFKKPADKKALHDFELAASTHSKTDVRNYFTEDTTLVIDTWADVGNGAMSVTWDCDLDAEALALLARLAANLNYLGRSESWVEATVLSPADTVPAGQDCLPHHDGVRPGPEYEQITLQAADDPTAFAAWRDAQVAKALEPFPLPEGKKPAKKLLDNRSAATTPYPVDLLDALQWDTARWKEHRWSQPPGSRRVLYWRRADALDLARSVQTRQHDATPVEAMLLTLTTPSGRRGGLPMAARALPQAELLHRALISRRGQGKRVDCPVLTGTDDDGRPLTGHRHARILPLDLDGDGHLDHILIIRAHDKGLILDGAAQAAIRSLQRTHTKGADDLQVALAASGTSTDLLRMPPPIGDSLHRLLTPHRIWQSVTPFVPPRHLKRRGAHTLEGQIAAELASLELTAAKITVLPVTDENARALRHHVRVRRDAAKAPPVDCGFSVRLEFSSPVAGPLALGYASHFGLGLFAAIQESS